MQQSSGRILVTGASGFIGRNLLALLVRTGLPHRAIGHAVAEADATTDWRELLRDVRHVVHLAGRHTGDAERFDRDVEMTLNFARQAAAAGVGRFVFLSSIKVNGERTAPGQVFRETDRPNPSDLYGQAKLRLEEALVGLAPGRTVIRAPLVYGPGVRANFRRLIQAVERGVPLPLAAVDNRRSMLAVGNLAHFILHALGDERTRGETYVLADGEDVSIADLLRRLARIRNRPSRLFAASPALLERSLRLTSLGGIADRLLGDLRVDIGKARDHGWVPPVSLDAGLAAVFQEPGATPGLSKL